MHIWNVRYPWSMFSLNVPSPNSYQGHITYFARLMKLLTHPYSVNVGLVSPHCDRSRLFISSSLDVLHALNPNVTPPQYLSRLVALSCITFALILHGTKLNWGLRLQNALGVFKIFVLVGVALSGMAVLARLPGFKLRDVGYIRLEVRVCI